MAAIGRMKWPISVDLLRPPHFPRNKTPLGWRALSKSMIVAALGDPIPKLMMVSPWSFVAACIGLPSPYRSHPKVYRTRFFGHTFTLRGMT